MVNVTEVELSMNTVQMGTTVHHLSWGPLGAALLSVCILASCGDSRDAGDPLSGEPGLFRLSFEHDGVQRETMVYVPSSYTVEQSAALMFNFHGYGGTGDAHLQWADMRALADRDGVIVAYPTGTEMDGSTHWNCSLPSADNKSTADDFGFVEVLIDTVAATYNLDEERVYAVGYSNGGMMAFGLACFLSDRVAAVGSVSGVMLDDAAADCETSHPTSVITLHGTADGVLPYEGGEGMLPAREAVDLWVDWNRADATPTTGEDASGGMAIQHWAHEGGTGGAAVHHYSYEGGDHVWFEETYEGKDASTLVWDFLIRFDQNGAL
jgi:polyhydroxybutyrate depolymerase